MSTEQQVVNTIGGTLIDIAAALYADHVADVGKMAARSATAGELTDQIGRLNPAFVGGLGEALRTGMLAAGTEGVKAVRRRRRKLKVTPPNPPVNGGASANKIPPLTPPLKQGGDRTLRAARAAEVVEYAGRNLEYDYLRLQSFTIAHVEDAALRNEVRDLLGEVLQGNLSWTEARTAISEKLDGLIGAGQIQTVVTTNLQTALAAGKYGEGMDAIEELPYWTYRTAGDNRVRPEHRALEGYTARKDDRSWDAIFPPNGYGCRCTVEENDELSVQEQRLTVGGGIPDGVVTPGFETNTAKFEQFLTQLVDGVGLEPLTAEAYGVGAIKAEPPPTPPLKQGGAAEQMIDYEGRVREIGQAVLSDPELARATLAGPAEIWCWPGQELKYIATYETEDGLKTVAVAVLGDVRGMQVVSGDGAEFRSGMLVWKKS